MNIDKGTAMLDINWEKVVRQSTLLQGAKLQGAHLQGADLQGADLQGADLQGADLREADLWKADLREANLWKADLREANLSNSKGLLNQIKYIKKNFASTAEGIIVYKIFNNYKVQNPNWKIEKGSIITEICDPSRTINCGCGINVATLDWCQNPSNQNNPKPEIWKCLIRWEWAVSVVVPYNTDGKIRTEKLELIEVV